jgi:hypothetical protein
MLFSKIFKKDVFEFYEIIRTQETEYDNLLLWLAPPPLSEFELRIFDSSIKLFTDVSASSS